MVSIQDPWSLARERYLETLTDEEKSLFSHASLENVFYTADTAQRSHEENSKSRALAKKLKPFFDILRQYGHALDIYSNASSQILAPLWGSIRVLLHVASEFDRYFERLVDMLVSIGDILPTFRVYEQLFAGHHFLMHALSEVYLDIIKFCTGAKKVFKKLKESRGLRIISSKFLWKPFEGQFEEVMNDFKKHKDKVENQAKLSHMIESASERGEARLYRARMDSLQIGLQWMTTLRHLSRIDHKYRHRQLRKKRYKNTGKWIFSTKQYQEWLGNTQSCSLWCHGIPGSGKTIITTTIVDTLLSGLGLRRPSVVVYFYCDYSDHRTVNTPKILGNFIKQLLSVIAIPQDIQSVILAAYRYRRKPDSEELLRILLMVLKLFPEVFFILDGIDECGGDDRIDLLEAIQLISKADSTIIKWFIASRTDVDLKSALNDCITLPISRNDIAADIGLFVKGIVRAKVGSGELRVRDQSLIKEIEDALVDGAHGMFVWVTFQIEDICDEMSDDGIRRALRTLPISLAETYTRALQKIYRNKKDVAQKIFRWVACARRPLSIGEIKEAIAISPQDRYLDATKTATDDSRIIQACANLVVFDSDEGTLRFAHYSVQEFLLSPPITETVSNFHFQLSDAEREIGEICITYLSFDQFETEVQKKIERVTTGLSIRELPFLFRNSYLGWFEKILYDAWTLLRGTNASQPQVPICWNDYLKYIRVLPTGHLQSQYRLLNYITENWVWHTLDFSDSDTRLWTRFRTLALSSDRPFSFRPWEHANTENGLPYMALVIWALEEGHVPLLRLLLKPHEGPVLSTYLNQKVEEERLSLLVVALHKCSKKGHEEMTKLLLDCKADPNAKDRFGDRSLLMAARGGHEAVVRILLERGADIHVKNSSGDTALQLAACGGYDMVVKLLLSKMTANDRKSKMGKALQVAISKQHKAVVRVLFAYGADRSKALYQASQEGRYAQVKFLIECGADFSTKSNAPRHTALHVAASGGHDTVVKLLLEHGADHTIKTDALGNTALHTAASAGHIKVVRLLLDWGVDPDITNNKGETASICALLHGYNMFESEAEEIARKEQRYISLGEIKGYGLCG